MHLMATIAMITTMVLAAMAEALDAWAGKPNPLLFHTPVPFLVKFSLGYKTK